MKFTAIIAEYNPLHNGHIYQLTEALKNTNPDALAVVMSGSAVQRGDFAIRGKRERASWAVKAGADIVLELPTVFAINNAEWFAKGAIKTLSAWEDVTLSFGSECGDISLLTACAKAMQTENQQFKDILNKKLDDGGLFAKSRAEAFSEIYPEFAEVINKPNNILALEYIKAASGLNIKLHTVKREDSGYNSQALGKKYSSARAVRETLFGGNVCDILPFVPDYVYNCLNNNVKVSDLSQIVLYKLKSMSVDEIASLYEVSEGLENRIAKSAKSCDNYNSLILDIKTKRYTLAKIKRIMLYAILGLTKQKMQSLLYAEPYFNVLALKEGRQDILSEFGKDNNLLIKTKDINKLSGFARESAELDKRTSDIASLLGIKDTI